MLKRIKYLKYKILELKSSGIERKIYNEKKRRIKQEILFKKMGAIGKVLRKIEYHQDFQKNYLIFKQRYGIEIPADVCGCGNKFELIKIKLKDLRRHWIEKEPIALTECAQYQYLKTKDEKIYLEYLNTYQQLNWMAKDSLTLSTDRFKKLFNTLKKEEYNPQKSIICIDKDNCVCDGLHRSCILLYLKGPEHEIPVVRISQDFFIF